MAFFRVCINPAQISHLSVGLSDFFLQYCQKHPKTGLFRVCFRQFQIAHFLICVNCTLEKIPTFLLLRH